MPEKWSPVLARVSRPGGLPFDAIARQRELNRLHLNRRTVTLSVDVCNENRRKAVEGAATIKERGQACWTTKAETFLVIRTLAMMISAVNGNLCAVHVHLSVAESVEPGPREKSRSRRRVGWDGEVVGTRQGAAFEDRVDHFEGFALVVGEGDLT